MRSRARALGHPMHPMLIVFPLGLWTAAVIFDLVYVLNGNETFSQVGFWNITAGLVGALVAAVTGLVDWLAIPGGTRAKSVGLLHGALNAGVVVLFLIAWLIRLDTAGHQPGALGFVIEVVAIAVGTGAAWFGGELVGRLGIGVDEDAHVDAPGSVSWGTRGAGRAQ
jgi:uncharacterized membrane protein